MSQAPHSAPSRPKNKSLGVKAENVTVHAVGVAAAAAAAAVQTPVVRRVQSGCLCSPVRRVGWETTTIMISTGTYLPHASPFRASISSLEVGPCYPSRWFACAFPAGPDPWVPYTARICMVDVQFSPERKKPLFPSWGTGPGRISHTFFSFSFRQVLPSQP